MQPQCKFWRPLANPAVNLQPARRADAAAFLLLALKPGLQGGSRRVISKGRRIEALDLMVTLR
jgi:hypothetical protein